MMYINTRTIMELLGKWIHKLTPVYQTINISQAFLYRSLSRILQIGYRLHFQGHSTYAQ